MSRKYEGIIVWNVITNLSFLTLSVVLRLVAVQLLVSRQGCVLWNPHTLHGSLTIPMSHSDYNCCW